MNELKEKKDIIIRDESETLTGEGVRELSKKIEVKVIFLGEEKNIPVLEEELFDKFERYLEVASESRAVGFSYYCALRKLFEEKEIEITLKCKNEKYIYDLDKKMVELENKRK